MNLINPWVFVITIIIFRVYTKATYSLYNPNILKWELPKKTIIHSFELLNLFIILFSTAWYIGSKITLNLKILFVSRKGYTAKVAWILVYLFLILEYTLLLKIVYGLGGWEVTFLYQAAIPSILLELGLSPYYGLMIASSIPVQIFCIYLLHRDMNKHFKITFKTKLIVAFLSIAVIIPFIIISRRSPIVFFFLPLLFYVHYRIHRLSGKKIILSSILAVSAFLLLSIIRMGYIIKKDLSVLSLEEFMRSPEFAIFDSLALTVFYKPNLEKLATIDAIIQHPEYLTKYYVAALIMKELFGFQFKGGTIPPMIIGNMYLWGDIPLVIIITFFVGFMFSVLNNFLVKNDILVFFSGYLALYLMQLILNGDVILVTKVMLRYVIIAIISILLFFKIRITKVRRIKCSASFR